jgi:hypothetical protein
VDPQLRANKQPGEGLDRKSLGHMSIFPMSALSSTFSWPERTILDYGRMYLLEMLVGAGLGVTNVQSSAGAEGAPIPFVCHS